MQPNYYDFNVRFPIYETNILNLTNAKHPDADFSLHENLERMILETGDEMKKSTNVKADMTNWTMHKTHTEIGFIGLGIMGKPMVLNLINAGFKIHFYARKKTINSSSPVLIFMINSIYRY